MKEDAVISVVSAATRMACRQMTVAHLDALQASLELASGLLRDLVLTVGPGADGLILSSRRRLLRQLRTSDADGAAKEMEHHLRGLQYMGRLACGASPARTTRPSPQDTPR